MLLLLTGCSPDAQARTAVGVGIAFVLLVLVGLVMEGVEFLTARRAHRSVVARMAEADRQFHADRALADHLRARQAYAHHLDRELRQLLGDEYARWL